MYKNIKSLAFVVVTTLFMVNSAYGGSLGNLTGTGCGTGGTACSMGAASNFEYTLDGSAGSGTWSDTVTVATLITGYVPAPTETTPIVYGTHLFNSGSSDVVLPDEGADTTKPIVAVTRYQVEGALGFSTFFMRLTLSNNAKFNGKPMLALDTQAGFSAAGADGDNGIFIEQKTQDDDKSTFEWTVKVLGNAVLADGDTFYFLYGVKNAQALQSAGETINMNLQLESNSYVTFEQRSIAVATSKEPVSMLLEKCAAPQIRVSVASGNTEFDSKTPTDELMSQYQVIMGYLTLKNEEGVMGNTGLHEWSLGDTAATPKFSAGYDENSTTNTTLMITDGQFGASVTDTQETTKGSVSIIKLDGEVIVDAIDVTSTEAKFELSNSDLTNIIDASEADGKVAIALKVDGKTPVNIQENPPTASFLLDYEDSDNKQDIEYPTSELCRFRQDGTRCWVYNVPPEGAQDILNLRITNDSSIAGEVKGSLYDMDGTLVFSNVKLHNANFRGEQVEKGQTILVSSSDIANNLEGGPYSWNNRAILNITSTLPRLEIMTLLRYDTVPTHPGTTLPMSPRMLTNLSTGAHGVSCQN